MTENMLKKMNDLVDKLNACADSYYNQATSLVSDRVYDSMFQELLDLEKVSGVIMPNSPTQKVGAEATGEEKAPLEYPCLSLNKTKERDVFLNFCYPHKGIYTIKLDGLTVQATYINGKLDKAITRGNGTVGVNVTEQFRYFVNVPQTIPYKDKLVVTGEAIITLDTLEKLNKDGSEYATCRNLASGTLLNKKDPRLCRTREMKFIVFNVNEHISLAENNFAYSLGEMEELGFQVVTAMSNNNDELSVINVLKMFAKAHKLPYDGLVCTYNDIEYAKKLGFTQHHPRAWLAFKFEDEEYTTSFRGITRGVTRAGKISMVADFDAVTIDNTTVAKALVPNYDMFKELKLGIGDKLVVRKANQIIPQIVENLTQSGTYELSCECPVCDSKLVFKGQDYYCTNPKCQGTLASRLVHFCSKDGMNIMGVSAATLIALMKNGFISELTDIYNLEEHMAEIANLKGFGEKSCESIIGSILLSKEKVPLSNYLCSLGIPRIGTTVAKLIEDYYSKNCKFNLKQLNYQLVEDLTNNRIEGITELLRSGLLEWFHCEENMGLANRILQQVYITLPMNTDVEFITKFTNKQVCITGTLQNYTRNQLIEILKKTGAKVQSHVSSNTNYLIKGKGGGRKSKDAENLGVTIISEEKLEEYLEVG